MPRPLTQLPDAERARLHAAWDASHEAQRQAEHARKALRTELRRLAKRYPVAAVARAVGVTPPAIWKRLRRD